MSSENLLHGIKTLLRTWPSESPYRKMVNLVINDWNLQKKHAGGEKLKEMNVWNDFTPQSDGNSSRGQKSRMKTKLLKSSTIALIEKYVNPLPPTALDGKCIPFPPAKSVIASLMEAATIESGMDVAVVNAIPWDKEALKPAQRKNTENGLAQMGDSEIDRVSAKIPTTCKVVMKRLDSNNIRMDKKDKFDKLTAKTKSDSVSSVSSARSDANIKSVERRVIPSNENDKEWRTVTNATTRKSNRIKTKVNFKEMNSKGLNTGSNALVQRIDNKGNGANDCSLVLRLHVYEEKNLVFNSDGKGNPVRIHEDVIIGLLKSMLIEDKVLTSNRPVMCFNGSMRFANSIVLLK